MKRARNLDRAFYAGLDAFNWRDPITTNPYKAGGKSWTAWREGWLHG